MGGIGSGRCSSRATTSNYHQVDVRSWHRAGLLGRRSFFCQWWKVETAPSTRSEPKLVCLYHRSAQVQQGIPDTVRLEWTPCNCGGSRPWFLGPERACGRRVAILYVGSTVACRHCRGLAYDSQHDSGFRRSVRRGSGDPYGLFKRLFKTVTKYKLADGATLALADRLPKSAPRNLRMLFSKAVETKETAPRLRIEKVADECVTSSP